MKRILIAALAAATVWAAGVRVNLVLGAGHPIHRPPRTVIVRRPVTPPVRVVYAAPVVWTRADVSIPPRPQLVWESAETLDRIDDWIDANLPVGSRGRAIYLHMKGQAQLDFAEVSFGSGQVQVVDFNEATLKQGAHLLLDFKDGRRVESVRLVARARTNRAIVTVLMAH